MLGFVFADISSDSRGKGLEAIAEETKDKDTVVVVGLPVNIGNSLHNCSVAVYKGCILGAVPSKSLYRITLNTMKTLVQKRSRHKRKYYCSADKAYQSALNLIFAAEGIENFTFGIEVCEDLWANIPPSCSLYSFRRAYYSKYFCK